jgi:hypothetical protein
MDHALADGGVGMLMIGQERRGDAVMGEQRLGHARILGEHGVGRGQHVERPERDVLEIADRRRHHMKAGSQRLSFGGEAEGREHACAAGWRRGPLAAVVDRSGHRNRVWHARRRQ